MADWVKDEELFEIRVPAQIATLASFSEGVRTSLSHTHTLFSSHLSPTHTIWFAPLSHTHTLWFAPLSFSHTHFLVRTSLSHTQIVVGCTSVSLAQIATLASFFKGVLHPKHTTLERCAL